VTVYKIVVHASNFYYNEGLAKAQIRDLSGAAACLRTSLKLNKNNIKARNLLGLVYFEMGEVVEGLSQWVISKHIRPEKNAAGIYIKKVQSSQNKLEAANQSVRKYNIALRYAKEQNYDLAVIQLKKIIQVNPKFVKAQLLLALLFIKNQEYEKAKRCLNQVLKVDKCNTLAQRYHKEIEILEYDEARANNDSFIPKKKKTEYENTPLNGNDVIVPQTGYKEPSNGAINVIYTLLGVVIGAAVIFFLIMPARLKTIRDDYNTTIVEYSEKLSDTNAEFADMEKQISDLKEERDEAVLQLQKYEGTDDNQGLYDIVIEAASDYLQGKHTQAVLGLITVDVAQLPTATAKNVYNLIMDECGSEAAAQLYEEGYGYYRAGSFKEAAQKLEQTIQIDSSMVEAVYYCAKSYEELEETEAATKWYQYIVDNFENLWYANDARSYLKNH
jgi:Tfp pilus assembly protein PilF